MLDFVIEAILYRFASLASSDRVCRRRNSRVTLTHLHLVFFFQAEVGIRATSVTGVQTCALPIWLRLHLPPAAGRHPQDRFRPGYLSGRSPQSGAVQEEGVNAFMDTRGAID